MAMIEIAAPDGSVVRFPEGTPDATIKNVMAKNYGGPQQPVSLQTFRTQYPAAPGMEAWRPRESGRAILGSDLTHL